jgi:hypothetical protein
MKLRKSKLEKEAKRTSKVIKEQALRYAQNFDYERLAELKELTGTTFSNEVYQELYSGLKDSNGHGNNLWDLKQKGVLSPPEDLVKKLYESFAKKGDYWATDDLYRATAITPEVSEKSAQKGYKHLVEENCASIVPMLERYTGIKPKFSEKFVHKHFRKYMQSPTEISEISELEDITGIKPNSEIQSVVKEYWEGRAKSQEFWDNLGKNKKKA